MCYVHPINLMALNSRHKVMELKEISTLALLFVSSALNKRPGPSSKITIYAIEGWKQPLPARGCVSLLFLGCST